MTERNLGSVPIEPPIKKRVVDGGELVVPTQAERELLLGKIESQGGKGKPLEQQESQGICSCSSQCNGPGICSCSCVDD